MIFVWKSFYLKKVYGVQTGWQADRFRVLNSNICVVEGEEGEEKEDDEEEGKEDDDDDEEED